MTRAGKQYALITDLGHHNGGPSVTNAAESLIRALVRRGHVAPRCKFIQHYEASEAGGRGAFDEVSLSAGGRAVWDTLRPAAVCSLLECRMSELTRGTIEDPRLVTEIGRLKQLLYPGQDLPQPDSTEAIQRRLQIYDSMISRAELQAVVQSGASERVLQQLLRRDLSLLGETYAHIPDEYICFTEFPIGTGLVDFVVFTGRSRMDVYLIEVKGADFNLLKANHYGSFNARIHDATTQISERYRVIHNAYESFCEELHRIRSEVEAGRPLLRSFAGPLIPLEVDPNKDVRIFPVVIGGRMRNDVSESRKRHNYETQRAVPIAVDSWDSWLNRLQRE